MLRYNVFHIILVVVVMVRTCADLSLYYENSQYVMLGQVSVGIEFLNAHYASKGADIHALCSSITHTNSLCSIYRHTSIVGREFVF